MGILNIIERHEHFIKQQIRLLPSENILSPVAREVMVSDMSGRYAHHFYSGKKHVLELIACVEELAKELFVAKHAFITPLSGNLCDLAALLAFSSPGDKVAMVADEDGGYPLNLEYFGRKRVNLPMNTGDFNLDGDASLELIQGEKPHLIILGTSFILHPIQKIREIVDSTHSFGGIVVYDASHPLGLIAGGQFQDPLREGVDCMIGSTHKSFPGPQGGLIFTDDDMLQKKLDVVIGADPTVPLVLVDNPHPGRIAALGIALEEMLDHGKEYAEQIVKNSQALQNGLLSTCLKEKIAGMDAGLSECHQVYINVENSIDEGLKFLNLLENQGILCDAGVRFGTSEVTRLGYEENDLRRIGEIIGSIVDGRLARGENEAMKKELVQMVQKHQEIVL